LLSSEILSLLRFASEYYHHPIGEVVTCALSRRLRQGKPALFQYKRRATADASAIIETYPKRIQTISPKLNSEQQNAVDEILKAKNTFSAFILNGVTSSGKTEVYLNAITPIVEQGQQALILVPEIGLTPQTIKRFSERFSKIVVAFHSGMNDIERHNSWLLAANGHASVVVGTRSSVFMSMPNLGMVIIDEEHDLSFKQQEGFRYSARDLAIKRAANAKIPIILGSATPALETLANIERQRYRCLMLPERAGAAKKPVIELVDLRHHQCDQGLSMPLVNAIHEHLSRQEQVMLFLNRRGFSPVFMCFECGWQSDCRQCDAKMTLHKNTARLHCHYCGYSVQPPDICPKCQHADLKPVGVGTERLEASLQAHFPQVEIIRIDRDTTQGKDQMELALAHIISDKPLILIGTQMLAKGHDFPNLTLVGIINADGGLFSTDFRATERMGQLITQVAGRAGRSHKPGRVIIQTVQPQHPLLTTLLTAGYGAFSQVLLKEREEAGLPPFMHWALLRAEGKTLEMAMEFLRPLSKLFPPGSLGSVPTKFLGPIPAPMQRKAGVYRAQLLIQSTCRKTFHSTLRHLALHLSTNAIKNRIRWSLDVDPLEIF